MIKLCFKNLDIFVGIRVHDFQKYYFALMLFYKGTLHQSRFLNCIQF
jgi:hypothetical protein